MGTAPFCKVMLGELFTGGLGGGNCVCGPIGPCGKTAGNGGPCDVTACGAGKGMNGDSLSLAPLLPNNFGPT